MLLNAIMKYVMIVCGIITFGILGMSVGDMLLYVNY